MGSCSVMSIKDPLSLLEPGPESPVQIRLNRACNACRDEALSCCYEALECARRTGDLRCTATAYLHLADICARWEQWAEGVDWARRGAYAFRVLGNYHNVMVALLMLGNLARSSGNLDQAESHYRKALSLCRRLLFEEKATGQRKASLYDRIDSEIRATIVETFSDLEARSDAEIRLYPISVLHSTDEPSKTTLVEANRIGYWTSRGDFLITGYSYAPTLLSPLWNGRVESRLSVDHFVLSVPEDGWLYPASDRRDYVLIRMEQQPTQEGAGVAWNGESWVGGQFERDTRTGRIRFVAIEPRIIGDEQPVRQGLVLALLKPRR
jgi:hypothetical protein